MARQPIFARLAIGARLKENQSPLFRWFLQHHAEFAAVLAEIARPSWKAIAEELRAEGLTTKDGSPIDGPYARLVWHRASKAYRARPSTPAPAVIIPQPEPSTPTPPPPAFQAVEVEPEPKYQFRFAGGVKKWTKTDPEPE